MKKIVLPFDLDHDDNNCICTCIININLGYIAEYVSNSFTCNTFLVDRYEKYPLTLYFPCGNYFLHHMLLMGIILQPFPLDVRGCAYIELNLKIKTTFRHNVNLN